MMKQNLSKFTMPDKFEDGWKTELPTAFDRCMSHNYIPCAPNSGPTFSKRDDNNFTVIILHIWTVFSCSSQMALWRRFAGLQQVMPHIRANLTFRHPQLKSSKPSLAFTL